MRVLEGKDEFHSSLNLSRGTHIEVFQNIFGQQSFTSNIEVLVFLCFFFLGGEGVITFSAIVGSGEVGRQF